MTDKEFLKAMEELEKTLKIKDDIKERKKYSFGSFSMDIASSVGGVVSGKLYEFRGWESSGKTTCALSVAVSVQQAGDRVLYVDSEYALDTVYAKQIGVDLDRSKFYVYSPDSLEQAIDYIESCLRKRLYGAIIIDSQDGLVPIKKMDGDTSTSTLGLKARVLSQELPKLVQLADEANTALIFISQMREKIGVIFGSNDTTSGGNALKFYASCIVEFRKNVKSEENLNLTKFKFIKNKLGIPYGKGEFELIWGKGVNRTGEIITLGVDLEIIEKSGSWYNYGEIRIGQGSKNACTFLDDNEELKKEIYKKIKEKIKEKTI